MKECGFRYYDSMPSPNFDSMGTDITACPKAYGPLGGLELLPGH